MGERRVDADVAISEQRGKVEIGGGQVTLLLERTGVQDAEDFGGLSIGHIWDELEGVLERRNDEGVVISEGSLCQIEAHAACVDDNQAGCVFPSLVDHNSRERGLEKFEKVAFGQERLAGLAVCLRCATIQAREVERLAVGCDIRGDGLALGGVECCVTLAILRVVSKCKTVPVKVSASDKKIRSSLFMGTFRATTCGVGSRRGRLARRIGNSTRSLGFAVGRLDAGQRKPSKRLAVPARLQPGSLGVVDSKVSDVRMTTEGLNGHICMHLADSIDHRADGATAVVSPDRVVTSNNKQIYGLGVVDSIQEPLLFYEIRSLQRPYISKGKAFAYLNRLTLVTFETFELPVKSNRTPKAIILNPCFVVKYRYFLPMYSHFPVAGLLICTLLVRYFSP